MVVIIPVSEVSILERVDYHVWNSMAKRHKALDCAMKRFKYADIIWRLNALAIRFKNRFPDYTKRYRSDMMYLRKKYRPDLLSK